MSEVKPWKVTQRATLTSLNLGNSGYGVWDGDRRVFVPKDATEAEVRQVCALPEIMAALEELVEAEYGVAAARRNRANQPDEYNRSMDRHDAAIEHLAELYERLK